MKQYLDQVGVEYLWNKIQQNFANLSNGGKVPASQLPSYVDDVEEYGSLASFPKTGEEGKIYVAKDTNLTYRWSGTGYVEISASIALGFTSDTAYPGDRGLANEKAIELEKKRAEAEELDIRNALNSEINRAQNSEKYNNTLINNVSNNLTAEINNREAADAKLTQDLANEAQARKDGDSAEASAREAADNILQSSINTEKSRAEAAERTITNNLEKEVTRAKEAEAKETADRIAADEEIKKLIKDETERAKGEESTISTNLTNEISRAKDAESDLASKITNEKNRATAAEDNLANKIAKEVEDRQAAITAEENRALAAEASLESKLGSVKIVKVTAVDANTASSYQLQVNGVAKGDTINVAKDQTIKDIEVLDMNATLNADGTIKAGTPVGTTALCISYILADGSYKLAKLDYSKFLEETEFTDGLQVVDHKVQVKKDSTSEKFLTVSANGVKISGIQSAIDTAVAAEKAAREAADTELKTLITSSGTASDTAIKAEKERAEKAEQAIANDLSAHIKDVNNPHQVTKSQVGLSNVDNTSDLNKPISNATQQALNKKADADKYLPLTGGELTGNLTAPKYVKTGGTSQQILLADGTVATAISQDTLNLILV